MIDFKEIPHEGDHWELLARDFLQKMGFHIETPPDRGPDGGKDLLITEEISGTTFKGRLRWLVSCKHFAHSGNSVRENDEQNILERVRSFSAEGFMGFYSTIPSSGLNTRLHQLRNEGQIKEYRIFDHKLIENYLITEGFSELMLRYFPESYKKIKPLHLVVDKYKPLICDHCGKDLLLSLFKEEYKALIAFVKHYDKDKNIECIEDVYCACKGDCDKALNERAKAQGYITGWRDLSDLVIPMEFLRFVFAIMNRLRDSHDIYADVAYKKLKYIIIALSQKVLRFTTQEERNRVLELLQMPF